MQRRRSSTHRFITTDIKSAWPFLLSGLLLVLLLGLPLLALLLRAGKENFMLYALSDMSMAALRLSLVTSLISVTISTVVGTPIAYILARWDFPGRNALELLIDLPVVLPPSVAGLALLIAFGRQGYFGSWLALFGISLPFTTTAVVMAQTFVSAPLFVRAARIGFAGIDPQLEEAAHVEGETTGVGDADILADQLLCRTDARPQNGQTNHPRAAAGRAAGNHRAGRPGRAGCVWPGRASPA